MQNNIETQKDEKQETNKKNSFSINVKKRETKDQHRALGVLIK